MTEIQWLRLLGLCGAGVIGATVWTLGDALIIGAKASPTTIR